MPLDDYGALIRSGQAAVPDYAADEAKKQLLALQHQEIQAKLVEAHREEAEQQGFQHDLATILSNPTAEGYSALIAKHPKFAAGVKQSWDVLDKHRQSADLQSMSEVYSAAANGKHDLAAALMQRRIDADKAAGQPEDPHDKAILDALNSGDPTQQKGALGMIGLTLSAVTGPDKFEQTLGALTKGHEGFSLSQGQKRFDAEGHVIAEVAPETDYLVIPEGGKAIPKPTGGGGQASPPEAATPPAAPGGSATRTHGYTPRQRDGGDNSDAAVDGKIATLARATGADPDAPMTFEQFGAFVRALPATEGNSGSLTEAANNPGGIKDGSFAKSQPGYVGSSKGFAVFKDRDSGFAAMQGLLTNRFYNRGQRSIRDIIEGKLTGAQPAAARGDPTGTLYGAPKAKPARMTAQEVAAEGLDPKVVYYRDANGVPQAVSGQSTRDNPLKPWPAQPLTARADNQAAVTNIDNALSLLDPKNNSPAAKNARSSIGVGTGILGDTFTQYNNPEGSDFRALLGQIGGVVIKDISGAAVTAAEDERLKKWVPRVTDRPEVAASKLRNMRREIQQRNMAFDTTYSPEQGYRPFAQGGAPVKVRSIQEMKKLAPGTVFITPDGRTMRKK